MFSRGQQSAPAGNGGFFGNVGNVLGGIGGIAGGLFGLFGQGRRMRQQHQNQLGLMNQQYANQRQLNQQGHDLQLEMWNKTNYPAQMAMLKEAGLNPALLYGMSGGGGTTTGSQGGGSASGGQAGILDIGSALASAKLGKELKLLEAQAENVEADTDKKDAETENIGADTILKGKQGAKFDADIEEIMSKIDLNKKLGITEDSKAKLNDALRELNNKRKLQVINETKLTDKEIEEMKTLGITRNSPMIMKTLKYLSQQAGIPEETIIKTGGGIYLFNQLMSPIIGMMGKF